MYMYRTAQCNKRRKCYLYYCRRIAPKYTVSGSLLQNRQVLAANGSGKLKLPNEYIASLTLDM